MNKISEGLRNVASAIVKLLEASIIFSVFGMINKPAKEETDNLKLAAEQLACSIAPSVDTASKLESLRGFENSFKTNESNIKNWQKTRFYQ